VLNARYEHRWMVHVQDVPGVADQSRKSTVRGWTHTVTPDEWTVTYTLLDVETYVFFTLDGGTPPGSATLDVMRLAA
jgi:hypothetical protein